MTDFQPLVVNSPEVCELVKKFRNAGIPYEFAVASIEREYLLQELQENRWNICKTADLMGIHRNTITRNFVRLRIDRATIHERRTNRRHQ